MQTLTPGPLPAVARRTALILLLAAPSLRAIEPAELPSDVKAVLEKTAAAYAGAETYTDDAVYRMNMRFGDMQIFQEMPWNLTLQKPNKANARAYGARAVSDGKEKYLHLTVLKQYKITPAPPALDIDTLFESAFTPLNGDPDMLTALVLLTSNNPLALLIDNAETAKKLPDQTLDGRPCHTILLADADIDTTLCIDKQSHLILRRQLKPKPGRSLPGAERAQDAAIETNFLNAKVGAPVSPDAFKIPNPDDAEKVDKFPFDRQAAQQPASPLVGKPAPDFTLKDLDGKDVKLASTAGKVVVLDFWATWCKPCLQAMPDMQKLYQKLEKNGVVFLGINTDRGSPKRQIKKIVDANNVTFPTLLDGTGTVRDKYGVTAIPTVVVIDKTGKVANVHLGTGPGKKRALTNEITRLLAK